jgi:hypothetical protein
MSLAKNVYELFSGDPALPEMKLCAGDTQTYRIEMENDHFDVEGEPIKSQKLSSNFVRTITRVPFSFMASTQIDLTSVQFTSHPGKPPMRWTFAEGLSLPYYLFCGQSEENLQIFFDESQDGEIAEQENEFAEVFTRFPKLPSVYLLIMQVMDIITFEQFASHFSSSSQLFTSPGQELRLPSLSSRQAQMGFGLYGDSSFFRNGDFFTRFLGYGWHEGRACLTFEYRCDGRLDMSDDTAQISRSRRGRSYYSGLLYLDIATCLPVLGTMVEYVIAVQNHTSSAGQAKVPVAIRRKVRLELLDRKGGEHDQ